MLDKNDLVGALIASKPGDERGDEVVSKIIESIDTIGCNNNTKNDNTS